MSTYHYIDISSVPPHPPIPPITHPFHQRGLDEEFGCVLINSATTEEVLNLSVCIVCLSLWSFSLYCYETLMPFPDEVLNLSVCIVRLSVWSFSLLIWNTYAFPWWGTEPVSVSFSSLVDEPHWYTAPLMRYWTCLSVLSVCNLTICMSPLYWMLKKSPKKVGAEKIFP